VSFVAALLALLDEVLKGLNLWQTGAQRAQDQQAGADALAGATAQDTAEIADEQGRNDIAPRSIDTIARELRDEAAADAGAGAQPGGAVRPADKLDAGAKA
jgi:uncharacterized membrane protein affecting hemolysin expression